MGNRCEGCSPRYDMQEPKLPPYLEGHEFYGGLVEATLADGWCYGAITQNPCPDHPEGCVSGDGFVVAPDGSYAGLVWWAECPWEFEQIGASKKDKFYDAQGRDSDPARR